MFSLSDVLDAGNMVTVKLEGEQLMEIFRVYTVSCFVKFQEKDKMTLELFYTHLLIISIYLKTIQLTTFNLFHFNYNHSKIDF